MLMECRVKFSSLQNTAGLSQVKGAAFIFETVSVNGDQDSDAKKIHYKTIKYPYSNCFKYFKCPKASTCRVVLKNVTDAMFLASLFPVACRREPRSYAHAHTASEAHATLRGTREKLPICRNNWMASLVSFAGTGLPGRSKHRCVCTVLGATGYSE